MGRRSKDRRPFFVHTYPFADLALARRLERAEATSNARFVELRAGLDPARGACWIEVGGTYAMYDGPSSPVTQTFGLGMFQAPTAGDFDRLERFFFDRGAPADHEVSPLTLFTRVVVGWYRSCGSASISRPGRSPAASNRCWLSPAL